jgi:hypothetical protein
MKRAFILSLGILLALCFGAQAYTPEEAKAIYESAQCKRTNLDLPGCWTCCVGVRVDCPEGQGEPIEGCSIPDINTFIHWEPVWDEPITPGNSAITFEEVTGVVDITANKYAEATTTTTHSWEEKDGWMVAVPEGVGQLADNEPAQLQYLVHLTTGGTYYVWISGAQVGGSSDSVKYAMDIAGGGTTFKSLTFLNKAFSNEIQEDGTRATITAGAGDHLLTIAMREDGSKFNRIVLTINPEWSP